MALNPFFLQGSTSEQGLVQDLVNEQLKMYGIECHYIPRKLVTSKTIMREVIESKFDEAFPLEAYMVNTDGYAGQGDILTKFGIRSTDEATFVISRERFEQAISPFLKEDGEYTLSNRPKEGDLIFFPLGKRLFEIKFVEHEKPFYQLKKNYVYELQCELFEYEDEVIDTDVAAIDSTVQTDGYIARLTLASIGSTATANTTVVYNAVNRIYPNNNTGITAVNEYLSNLETTRGNVLKTYNYDTNVGQRFVTDKTTLSGNETATDTTIGVASASGISVNDIIVVNNEEMLVGTSHSSHLHVIRGNNNTTATTHADGDKVLLKDNSSALITFSICFCFSRSSGKASLIISHNVSTNL